MIANSPAAVAAASSSSSRPVSPGDSRCAAMPAPITTAARNALPASSAVSRRHSAVSVMGPFFIDRHRSGAQLASLNRRASR
jgi:hypothetical protein